MFVWMMKDQKLISLINDLKIEYSAVYNENVEMLSIRHYTAEAIDRISVGGRFFLNRGPGALLDLW